MQLAARIRDRWIDWTIAVVGATGVYAIAVALTGGFKIKVAGLRFSSQSWERPAIVAVIGAVTLVIGGRARVATLLRNLAGVLESSAVARAIVVAAAIWTVACGIGFGTFAIGGSDSYGYVGQARLFAHGKLTD